MSNATRFRVIFHPPVCPACGGTDITTSTWTPATD